MMKRILRFSGAPVVAIAVAVILLPTVVMAQGSIRDAGNQARFRVIDRFPDQDSSPVEIPRISEGSPLYPVAVAAERENWSTALRRATEEDLEEVLSTHPEKRFLVAVVAHRAGDHERALKEFEALGDELPLMNDYRALFTARSSMEIGKPHEATLAAASIDSESRLYPLGLLLMARGLRESGETTDREQAVEVLELFLQRFSGRSEAASARLDLGELLEDLGEKERAARAYLTLRDQSPLSAEASSAVSRLERLREDLSEALQRRIAEEPQERTLRQFRGLYERHQSDRVIDELGPRVDEFESDTEERCEALFMVAHSHTKLRRHGDGTPWYDRVLQECAGRSWEIRAMYLGGRGRWNAGDRAGAMRIFERIWTEYAGHSFADDAMFFTGRILRSEGRHDEAREILLEQVERYPDGDMAKDAHWLLVRRMFETEDYEGVVDYVDGLEETGEDDLYSKGRLHYFRARALEMQGNDEDAAAGFVGVVREVPKSYYALLAFNRLARKGGATDAGGVDICATAGPVCEELLPPRQAGEPIGVPRALQEDEGFQRGVLLLSLGLMDLARQEFTNLRQRRAQPANLWALASLLHAAEAYPLSHDIARRHIPDWMGEYPTAATRARWEVAYPTPFRDEVIRYARQRQIDPALIYAIMREESGFSPRVESWANARGLLQLIEGTARQMAEREGMSNFSFDQLFDPAVNLRLGSAFMENLGERLGGHPALTMAGYNAGVSVVSGWVEEFGDEPLDLFVEDIPFGQTRNYTKRVMMSFWIYSYLYGEERVPHVAFNLD